MSIKAMSDYTFYAKYSRFLPEKNRREIWAETTERVFDMHRTYLKNKLGNISEELEEYISLAELYVKQKRVLGSQRALQFGGDPILKHNEKLFNCSGTYIDRPRAFQEVLYLLLCGVGVGFSIQTHHVNNLPEITKHNNTKPLKWVVDDSIEGWADAVGVLMNSYFTSGWDDEFDSSIRGRDIEFDFSHIRPSGAFINGGFLAPGPDGLKQSLIKIKQVIENRLSNNENRLHPIDVYDILMHCSDAVLSGGVRRAACIALFSKDDEEMLKAKTGKWFIENPQRGRSNNSAVIKRDECNKDDFKKIIENVKEFGEPGFIFVNDLETVVNPCVEVTIRPRLDDNRTGVSFCNLCEINMKKCKSEEDFYSACKAAAVIGTIQASYTNFTYLTDTTKEIVEKEALLGVSMTGMMDSPEIAFDAEVQRKGAKIVKKVNEHIAKLIGINKAARCTNVKPAGSSSIILGASSGIHPHHARRYFRRIQANVNEFPLKYFESINPKAVETSVWSNTGTDKVVIFTCEVPAGSITKNQLGAIDLLERVKLTQQNWIEYGTREECCLKPYLRHNVSNTISVKPEEWELVTDYLFKNRNYFTGVSLLPIAGDKDLPQVPFTTIYTQEEIVKHYGAGAMFASGLIVHAHKAFNDNLWKACRCALEQEDYDKTNECQVKWIQRFNQFAERYMDDDKKKLTYLLKDVDNLKLWCDINRTNKEIDWSEVKEPNPYMIAIDTTGASGCTGGKCELI